MQLVYNQMEIQQGLPIFASKINYINFIRMKKTILIAALGLFSLSAMAQDAKPEGGFVFTTVKENPITSIKNQNRSSTCWSFSALGFLESELLRMGKGEYDFSEMFVVFLTSSFLVTSSCFTIIDCT